MKTGDRAAALGLLLLAIYTVAAARELSYMQGRTPGPGFAPLWIGVGLAIASAVVLLRRREPDAGGSTPPGRTRLLLAIAAITTAGAALIEPLGMNAALALLLLALVRLFGGSWRAAAATAVALPVCLFVLFGLWLKVPLPRGPWGF